MIVRMKKVFLVARADDRGRMLDTLRDLGVVHLEPVSPDPEPPEGLVANLDRVRRAVQVLSTIAPAGDAPELDADTAADEVVTTLHRTDQNRNRLAALHREAGRLDIWGELRLEQLDALIAAGVPVRFYSVPAGQLDDFHAEFVAALSELPGKRILAAVVHRDGAPEVPDQAEPIETPGRDLPTVRAEAKQVDEAMAADSARLAELANLADALGRRRVELEAQIEYETARAGALRGEDLFAVQGWAPAGAAGTLAADLAGRGLDAAVESRPPADDEDPPTLIRYPRWASPIKGLFDILGTSPGYKELDVSSFFMIALPIFAAMLIGDGGYGLVFLVPMLVLYRKVSARVGPDLPRLVIAIGAVSVIWGVITATFFGVTGEQMAAAGGLWGPIGRMLQTLRLVRSDSSSESQNLLMNACFVIGAVHLSIAHLRRGLAFFPNLKFLNSVGWATFLWGMLGVVQYYVLGRPFGWSQPYPYLLIAGGVFAVLFARPRWNILLMVLTGLASFPLSAISTFSDIISYVRLSAVGLASGVLAVSFNELAFGAGAWYITVVILVLGHALNVGLCVIALFAHGVRLNMLEFSTNAGVEWAGFPYEPFAKKTV